MRPMHGTRRVPITSTLAETFPKTEPAHPLGCGSFFLKKSRKIFIKIAFIWWKNILALIKCPTNATNGIIRYDIAGGQKVDNLLLINNGRVYRCNIETIEECCDSLGVALPFDLHVEVRRFCCPSNTEGWEKRDWWYKKTDEIGFSEHEWKSLLV